MKPWLAELLQKQGLTPEAARARAEQVTFGFEPGDIVSEVMSFGSPTPIEVVVGSPNLADARAHAERIAAEMEKIPSLRDVQFEQALDYPTVEVEIDREKAGLSGVTAAAGGRRGGRGDLVEPFRRPQLLGRPEDRHRLPGRRSRSRTPRMNSPEQVETVPLADGEPRPEPDDPRRGQVGQGAMPGEIDRTTIAALPEPDRQRRGRGHGPGLAAGRAGHRRRRASRPGASGSRRAGQVAPMREMFTALGIGLGVAVVVILVLLTAYFQSPRLALASVSARAGRALRRRGHAAADRHDAQHRVVHGGDHVHRRVGVELGHAGDVHRRALAARASPSAEAAIAGASDRLRPILMTACAMTVGMVPMALALEQGSEMQAPLGRAVIGGLVVSTFATLLHRPVRLRPADGPAGGPLAVALPGRPGELALRPGRPRARSGPRGLHRLSPRSPGGPPMNRIWLTLLLLPGLACGCSEAGSRLPRRRSASTRRSRWSTPSPGPWCAPSSSRG